MLWRGGAGNDRPGRGVVGLGDQLVRLTIQPLGALGVDQQKRPALRDQLGFHRLDEVDGRLDRIISRGGRMCLDQDVNDADSSRLARPIGSVTHSPPLIATFRLPPVRA